MVARKRQILSQRLLRMRPLWPLRLLLHLPLCLLPRLLPRLSTHEVGDILFFLQNLCLEGEPRHKDTARKGRDTRAAAPWRWPADRPTR